MNAPTDWASAVAILAAGIVVGLLFVFTFNKRRKTFGDDVALKDLQAKRDALLQQLRDPAVDGAERTRLELETADVLRRLDAYGARPAATSDAATAAAPMNPTVKGFLWGAGSVAALAALGYFVMQQATPRAADGSLTGGNAPAAPMAAAPAQGQPDPVVQQLEAAVQRDPNNLQLRNDLAQAYLEKENLMAVFQQTQFVLEKSPNDSRALTFQGLVRMAMGETDEAMKMLERATEHNAKNLDAWVARAWIYAQSNRMSDAERMIAEAAKQSPADKPRLDQVFSQMKQQIAQQAAGGGGGSELPTDHPPINAAAAAAPAAPPSGPSVRVTVNLDPSAGQRTGILFVIARNPVGGPPAAVKRIAGPTFPVTFDLSSADSMMGQPLPPSFRLEARLDSDGDATTKPPTDPSAMQEGVTAGATVTLALK